MGRTETQDITVSMRISKRLHDEILVEQQRLAKLTGIEPSINEVVRMFLERGMKTNGKKRGT